MRVWNMLCIFPHTHSPNLPNKTPQTILEEREREREWERDRSKVGKVLKPEITSRLSPDAR